MAKTNPEAPMIKQGKWKYTWHMMKTNKACYAMLLPFMSLFIICLLYTSDAADD